MDEMALCDKSSSQMLNAAKFENDTAGIFKSRLCERSKLRKSEGKKKPMYDIKQQHISLLTIPIRHRKIYFREEISENCTKHPRLVCRPRFQIVFVVDRATNYVRHLTANGIQKVNIFFS